MAPNLFSQVHKIGVGKIYTFLTIPAEIVKNRRNFLQLGLIPWGG